MARDLEEYLRPGGTTIFCPGCGHGILQGLIVRAISELKIKMEDLLIVGCVGCAGHLAADYINVDSAYVLHGRSIPFATGAKMFNPKLHVLIVSGDGALVDIGGNHLIHAAWRNTDITVICATNFLYGMTGGQFCSTTPEGAFTMTTTQGNPYHPLDLCKLVAAAGATYIARYSVTQPFLLINSIKKAMLTPGFSFIEAMSPCPTQYGRRNQLENSSDMFRSLMERCITKEEAQRLSLEELEDKIITGEFTKKNETG